MSNANNIKEAISIRLDSEDIKELKKLGRADSVVAGIRELLRIHRSQNSAKSDLTAEQQKFEDVRRGIAKLEAMSFDPNEIKKLKKNLETAQAKYIETTLNTVKYTLKEVNSIAQ